MAKVFAAIIATFCATASCLPIGAPHCTRSFAQVRDACSSALLPPAQLAGSVSRPVLSVISASLSPLPSPHRMFSRGTRTFVKRMTPFSIALSPMKRQRCTTSTPGWLASTMNAVICLRLLPFTTASGVRAITRNSSARVPFVHQSFSPLRMNSLPSGDSSACGVHVRGIGAGVHLGEREGADRTLGQAREEPLLLLVGAEQLERLRQADGLVRRQQRGERAVLRRHHRHRLDVAGVRQPETAVLASGS